MDLHAHDFEPPPLDVDEASVKADDRAFAGKCLSIVEDRFAVESWQSWQLGQTSLTRSSKWGLVWRADFSILSEGRWHSCNRVLCWENADGTPILMIAFRTDLTPLPSDE